MYLVVYLRQILAQFRDAGHYRVTEASEKTVNVSLAAAVSGRGTVSPVDKNVFEMYRKLLTHTLTVQSIYTS